jgi:hypothetical protein
MGRHFIIADGEYPYKIVQVSSSCCDISRWKSKHEPIDRAMDGCHLPVDQPDPPVLGGRWQVG